jgi:hypothetical protein
VKELLELRANPNSVRPLCALLDVPRPVHRALFFSILVGVGPAQADLPLHTAAQNGFASVAEVPTDRLSVQNENNTGRCGNSPVVSL